MARAAPLSLLIAAFLLPFAAHASDDDDSISTDRPDFVESSQVVGKGRVQLETSVQWERDRHADPRTRTVSTPTLLRIGVGDSTELRIETDGRSVTRGATAGYADSALGLKWHLADQQGETLEGRPSLGVLLHAELPSGSRSLRGHGVRPTLRLSAEWDLADGYSLGVMPGLGQDSDDAGHRYGYGILAATLGKALNERMRGYVELAAPQIARGKHGGAQASFDTGVTYLVNKDCQLDLSLTRGLNRRTPDLSLAFGLSVRI